jgi:NRPS condensation-like uncharacterized protein
MNYAAGAKLENKRRQPKAKKPMMSEKQNDVKKMIEKMRTNTKEQNRSTEAKPWRRSGKKVQKTRKKTGSENQA